MTLNNGTSKNVMFGKQELGRDVLQEGRFYITLPRSEMSRI